MPSGSKVVFVYGPPAVGKLTVASLLAERTGFKLSHNHAIIDAVVPLFDYGTGPFGNSSTASARRSSRLQSASGSTSS